MRNYYNPSLFWSGSHLAPFSSHEIQTMLTIPTDFQLTQNVSLYNSSAYNRSQGSTASGAVFKTEIADVFTYLQIVVISQPRTVLQHPAFH